jgi:hypothetical protein
MIRTGRVASLTLSRRGPSSCPYSRTSWKRNSQKFACRAFSEGGSSHGGAKTAVRRSGNAMSSRMALTRTRSDPASTVVNLSSTSTRGRPRRFRDDTPTSRVERFSYLTLQPFGRGSSIRSPSSVVPDGTRNVTKRTASPLPWLRTSIGWS